MGYILLSSKRDADTDALVNEKLIADDDLDRLIYAWANIIYPQGVWVAEVPAVLDEQGVEVTPAVPGYFRPPTGTEVFNMLTERIINDIKAQTEAFYLRKAEEAARVSVTPITLTPNE